MATSALDQLYPFSTEDGNAIPLDIVRPMWLLVNALPAAAVTVVTIAADVVNASVFASINCFIDFSGAGPYAGLPYEMTDGLFLPANTLLTVALPRTGAVNVVPLQPDAGFIVLQQVTKWAGIGLARQIVRR